MTSSKLNEGGSEAESAYAHIMSLAYGAQPSQLRIAYDFLQKEHVNLLREKGMMNADNEALQAEVERLRDEVRKQGEELHRVEVEATSTRRIVERKLEGYAALLKEEARAVERLRVEKDMLATELQAVEYALKASNQEVAALRADAERRAARDLDEWRSRMLQRCNELVPLFETRLADLKATQESLSSLDDVDAEKAMVHPEEYDHRFLLQLLFPPSDTKTQRRPPTHNTPPIPVPTSSVDRIHPSTSSTPQPGILRGDLLTFGLATPKQTPDEAVVSLTSYAEAPIQPSAPAPVPDPQSTSEILPPQTDPPSPIELFGTPSPDHAENQLDVVQVCAALVSWSRVRKAFECFVAMSQSDKVRFLRQRVLSRKEEGPSKDAPMMKFLSSAVGSEMYGVARLEEDLRSVAEDISDTESFSAFLSRTPLSSATKQKLIRVAETSSAKTRVQGSGGGAGGAGLKFAD